MRPPNAGQPRFTDAIGWDAQLLQQWQHYEALQQRRQNLPTDVLLEYTPFDKALHQLKTLFVTVPKAVVRGLQGSKDYTFSDSMLVSKIPYYLGGLFLMGSFVAGGNRCEGVRQGVATALYLLGMGVTSSAINWMYRLRYGVDLTMMYRSKSGQVEKVFASSDFPRFDLLTDKQYKAMARKMGVSPALYDQDGAVREHLREIITNSRALKLIVGNVISAVGAGYLARTDAWLHVPKAMPLLKTIWANKQASHLQKLSKTMGILAETVRPALSSKLNAPVLLLGALAAISTIGYIWFKGIQPRSYVLGAKSPLEQYLQQNPQSRFVALQNLGPYAGGGVR